MGVLRQNPLLWGSVWFVVIYWLATPFITNPYLSSFFSLVLMIWGSLTLAQYAWETFEIVVLKVRSNDEKGRGRGSHLAIYGIFLFAFGSVFSGTYGLWWNYNAQPPDWIGSPGSQFGRACHFAAFILMQVSPAVTKEGLAFRARWWIVAAVIAAAVSVGFFFGMQVRTIEVTDGMRAWRLFNSDRPPCPLDRVIWGSQSKIYHNKDSPYRMLLAPSRCFQNESEAQEAGFRPPKGS